MEENDYEVSASCVNGRNIVRFPQTKSYVSVLKANIFTCNLKGVHPLQ